MRESFAHSTPSARVERLLDPKPQTLNPKPEPAPDQTPFPLPKASFTTKIDVLILHEEHSDCLLWRPEMCPPYATEYSANVHKAL